MEKINGIIIDGEVLRLSKANVISIAPFGTTSCARTHCGIAQKSLVISATRPNSPIN